MHRILFLLFIFAGLISAQTVEELLQSGALQSSGVSSQMIDQVLSQQRGKGTTITTVQGDTRLGANKTDSTNLFIGPDSILAYPTPENDTLYYLIRTDTISVVDMARDSTVIEKLGRSPTELDKVIVRRKVKVNRSEVKSAERYESTFFKNTPAALFGSTTNAINGDYPLKSGDELILTLWGEVEKEYPLSINNQGKIMLEGVGLVSLLNMNLAEAEALLKQRLAKTNSGISRNKTFVNLRLEKLSPIKVFVVGEVTKPGGYVFYGNTSVFQALYFAGGPSSIGSVRQVQITREDTSFTVDLYEYLMHGRKPSPSVLVDGDIVFLPRAQIIAEVRGEVGRPALYELKAEEGMKELLQFAGNANPNAAVHKTLVRRISPDGKVVIIDMATPADFVAGKSQEKVVNGDVLLVRTSTEEPKELVSVYGAVKYQGTYQFKPGMNLADLLAVAGGPKDDAYLGRVQVLRLRQTGGYDLFAEAMDAGQKGLELKALDTIVVFSYKDLYRPDSVLISGAVARPGYYEFFKGMTAKDLILKAGGFLPSREVGKLRLERSQSKTRDMDVSVVDIVDNYHVDGSQTALEPWDHIEVPIDPNFSRAAIVKLRGAFKKPGNYALLYPGETVKELVARTGGFQNDAYVGGARFYRGLDSIGQIGFDMNEALSGEKMNNIHLQAGDSVYLPVTVAHVTVMGEVNYPSNVLFRPGKSASWYISQAGGFKETSNEDRVFIRYANGSVSAEVDAEMDPDPGAIIVVPYKQPPAPVNWFQVATTVATVLGTLATVWMTWAVVTGKVTK